MLYAMLNRARALATPGARGSCPGCGAGMIAKCGDLLVWHWAHLVGSSCDPGYEPKGDWHIRWQSAAPEDRREVFRAGRVADMIAPDGVAVEVQHSSITAAEIAARERAHGEVRWIFDVREPVNAGRLKLSVGGPGYVSFYWDSPRASITACVGRVYLDLGYGLVLSVEKIGDRASNGWGWLWAEESVRRWVAGPDFRSGWLAPSPPRRPETRMDFARRVEPLFVDPDYWQLYALTTRDLWDEAYVDE